MIRGEMWHLLDKVYYQNAIRSWLIALAVFVVSFLVLKLIKSFSFRHLSRITAKTASEWDDLIPQLIERLHSLFFAALSLSLSAWTLEISESSWPLIKKFVLIVFLFQTAFLTAYSINYWLTLYKKHQIVKNASAVTTFVAVAFILRVVLWSIILLLVLANLGVNVTALVTGLGVSGIAVALAVQNILGDLFASFSIVLDKPFVIGDFIIVDDYLGTVEKVGIKTTRIRSLSGEQLIFSNTDLLKSRIRNYKRMYERRVVFGFGVTYQTGYEHLATIPGMVREIIESQAPVRFGCPAGRH